MSDESVTAEEVDTLLEGVSTEDAERAAAVGRSHEGMSSDVRRYDLTAGPQAPQRLPVLDAINERTALNLRNILSELLDQAVDVVAYPVEQHAYDEFLTTLPEPANVNVLESRGLGGPAMLVCEPALMISLTDLLFGGSGADAGSLDGREFSPTELRIIQRIVRHFIEATESAWAGVHTLGLEHVRLEYSPRFASIASAQAMVLTTRFEVRIGELRGTMILCLPVGTIESVRRALASSEPDATQVPNPQWQQHMAQQIQSAEVVVSAEFAQTTATVADLMRLKPGDFIALDLRPTAVVRVDDVPFFECRYGVSNKRYAVRIQTFLTARQEAEPGDSQS